MELIISNATTAIINLLLFSILPFIWWKIKKRKEIGFFNYVGLRLPRFQCKKQEVLIFAVLYFISYSGILSSILSMVGIAESSSSDTLAVDAYIGIGAAAILPAIIEDFISTGLAEELFFRGFLCKRLSAKMGTVIGLIAQALLFGLMHNILYFIVGVEIGFAGHFSLLIETAIVGLTFGWVNERVFAGSIIPSVLLHSLGNFSCSISEAFQVFNLWGQYSTYIVIGFSFGAFLFMAKREKQGS